MALLLVHGDLLRRFVPLSLHPSTQQSLLVRRSACRTDVDRGPSLSWMFRWHEVAVAAGVKLLACFKGFRRECARLSPEHSSQELLTGAGCCWRRPASGGQTGGWSSLPCSIPLSTPCRCSCHQHSSWGLFALQLPGASGSSHLLALRPQQVCTGLCTLQSVSMHTCLASCAVGAGLTAEVRDLLCAALHLPAVHWQGIYWVVLGWRNLCSLDMRPCGLHGVRGWRLE